ncbi:aspartate kinase [Winogradskyella psychrotolerans]|uniref:aspartate kinase n=1 Tax=Winogradskyella psychrotolerans TaxID=1344585 RepID=UPI001C070FEA|nr:aspartate kinase [Winogradskyella psychrotolerans]MBU2922591.1 aspartate kinase [Winogradskyella psychrotolerans]
MTTINIAVFGIGNVGATLINQIHELNQKLRKEQQLNLRIRSIANSTSAHFTDAISKNWQTDFTTSAVPYNITDIIAYFKAENLEHVVAIDATASASFVAQYKQLIENGCHIISANKIANTLNHQFYQDLRLTLKKNKKKFLYETNVGAGLPVIDTIKNLYRSGDNIIKIRGVFSGSLSYIFNTFSKETLAFNEVLSSATKKGFTEPDPREDLSGKDVARKLLILARELGIQTELNDVAIESLVPEHLNGNTTLDEFEARSSELNPIFEQHKKSQNPESVLRYIGELDTKHNTLEVKLISTPKSSALGQLKGSDTLFEIFTEEYNEQPLVIQGAGAGKAVTARGVLSDILKLAVNLN